MKYFKYLNFRLNMDNVISYCPGEKRMKEVIQLHVLWIPAWRVSSKKYVLHYILFTVTGAKDLWVKFPDEKMRDDCLLKLDKFIKVYTLQKHDK